MVSYEGAKETIKYLVHWENPPASAGVLSAILAVLVSICYFSLIAVIAYISLAVLLIIMGIKVYSFAMVFMKKADPSDDPLLSLTNVDVNIPPEKVAEITGILVDIANPSIMELRRLFLLESVFDTIKFILCLWGLTYIGSWFNMMTLIILSWVGVFTIPLLYKNNQASVDEVVTQVNTQVNDIKEKVMAIIPIKNKALMQKEE